MEANEAIRASEAIAHARHSPCNLPVTGYATKSATVLEEAFRLSNVRGHQTLQCNLQAIDDILIKISSGSHDVGIPRVTNGPAYVGIKMTGRGAFSVGYMGKEHYLSFKDDIVTAKPVVDEEILSKYATSVLINHLGRAFFSLKPSQIDRRSTYLTWSNGRLHLNADCCVLSFEGMRLRLKASPINQDNPSLTLISHEAAKIARTLQTIERDKELIDLVAKNINHKITQYLAEGIFSEMIVDIINYQRGSLDLRVKTMGNSGRQMTGRTFVRFEITRPDEACLEALVENLESDAGYERSVAKRTAGGIELDPLTANALRSSEDLLSLAKIALEERQGGTVDGLGSVHYDRGKITVRSQIAPGVKAENASLVIDEHLIPKAVQAALTRGQPAQVIVNHPWLENLTIQKVRTTSRKGSAVVVVKLEGPSELLKNIKLSS